MFVLLNTSSWAIWSDNPFITGLIEHWELELFIQILSMVIQVPFRIPNDGKATELLSTHCTARWYVLPPSRRNMILKCKRCKNFAFPIPDFPCASYNRNHAHRHLVNTHLAWTIIHVHIVITHKPRIRNTSTHNL
jgi:hypothetical protein